MKVMLAAVMLTTLALGNGVTLYWFQYRSNYWLPATETGKWRLAPPIKAILRNKKAAAAEQAGYRSFADMPVAEQHRLEAQWQQTYPADARERMEVRNMFRDYVSTVGMWQWPLSIAALLLAAVTVAKAKGRSRVLGVGLILLSTALVIDATYRSYFGALGW